MFLTDNIRSYIIKRSSIFKALRLIFHIKQCLLLLFQWQITLKITLGSWKRYTDISTLFTCLKDARGKQIYIATQGNIIHRIILLFFFTIIVIHMLYYILLFWSGPKPKTISDFWTMIWQEGVCNIVCLTNLKEGTKVQKYMLEFHFQN